MARTFFGDFAISRLNATTAAVRIGGDSGGSIGPFLSKYRALRASGERVEIDGTCASACTMLLGIIPRDHICVTTRAKLIFTSKYPGGREGIGLRR